MTWKLSTYKLLKYFRDNRQNTDLSIIILYSRKSVRPRMEPWGNPALTGYSYEETERNILVGNSFLTEVELNKLCLM